MGSCNALRILYILVPCLAFWTLSASPTSVPHHNGSSRTVPASVYAELEELARLVDIAYCVTLTGPGIGEPFECPSRCTDFPHNELITTWNTGPLLADSCGYIALSHPPASRHIIIAFRGTYSIANAVTDLSTIPQKYEPYCGKGVELETDSTLSTKSCTYGTGTTHPQSSSSCRNCTVHSGFFQSWRSTRALIFPYVEEAVARFPDYKLTVIGHSLGGAVAALASLDFVARGWKPEVTTFGEPRVGNEAMARYIDAAFNLSYANATAKSGMYRRMTHSGDPVPLLPLEEWGYQMHGGEIYISKPELAPNASDLRYCYGHDDPGCIAGEYEWSSIRAIAQIGAQRNQAIMDRSEWNGLLGTLNAHRDYFSRLGLCVPKA